MGEEARQGKVIVVLSEEGNVKEKNVIEGSLDNVVRKVAEKALKMWDPLSSDFTVIKSFLELRYRLPIDPDLYDRLLELGLEMMREGNELIVKLPVFTISFDNKWVDDTYMDRKMYVIAPVLDDESIAQIVEYASEATKAPKRVSGSLEPLELDEEAIKRLEEGLGEAEISEKSERQRKKRTKGRKKS